MLLFRSEEHVDHWCRTWRMERGGLLTLDGAGALAAAWYAPDRRAPEWRRRTPKEVEALFLSLGMTGSFWSLRPPSET